MDKNSKNFDTSHTTGELFSLSPVKNTRLEVSFTAPDLSSDGGLLLMKEYERQTGFLNRVSDCISDIRSQLFVQHSYYEMLRQRIYRIAASYEDADDSDFNTYGEQQGTHYYGKYCYMPLFIFEGDKRKNDTAATPSRSPQQIGMHVQNPSPN